MAILQQPSTRNLSTRTHQPNQNGLHYRPMNDPNTSLWPDAAAQLLHSNRTDCKLGGLQHLSRGQDFYFQAMTRFAEILRW
jgi:hypothetical protein